MRKHYVWGKGREVRILTVAYYKTYYDVQRLYTHCGVIKSLEELVNRFGLKAAAMGIVGAADGEIKHDEPDTTEELHRIIREFYRESKQDGFESYPLVEDSTR